MNIKTGKDKKYFNFQFSMCITSLWRVFKHSNTKNWNLGIYGLILLKHPKYFRLAVLRSILKFAPLVKYKPKYFTLELQPRVSLFSCKVALGVLPPKVIRWLITGLNNISHVTP